MVSLIISRVIILVFGTLYPAYASYKAVKTKNVKEYVKWMMYWIVFAFFTCVETICDIFVSWIPFYYEMKIIFVLWLLSPATKGSSILYRKFVHPQLTKREKEIDSYIAKASDQGYTALITLGSKGLNYATNIVLNTAMKGQTKIADHLRKSYSLNDLSQDDSQRFIRQESDISELDDETDHGNIRPYRDNRMIEESYQSEMLEKDLDEGEGVRKRRSLRSKDTGDLPPVDEEEDAEGGRQKNKKAYSHKEKLKEGISSTPTPTPPSSPSPSRSLPSTPAPIVPGYTPFSRYGRSTSWEPSSTSASAKPTGSKPVSSWRTRTSYSSYTSK